MSTNLFRVVVADMPWKYNDRGEKCKLNPDKATKFGVGVQRRYSAGTMTTQEILDLGAHLRPLLADDAYLISWVTCPRLKEGIAALEAWGFRYINVPFFWSKVYSNGDSFSGPGRYVPSNLEFTILGVRGKPWHKSTGSKPRQEIRCPHPRDPSSGKIIHSRKPEEMQDRLDKWLGPFIGEFDKLEMFATRQRPGWKCLGHQLSSSRIDQDLDHLAQELKEKK